MKKWYGQLSSLNGDLLRAYKIRNQNHVDLMDALKLLNQYIQKASKLRGKKKYFLLFCTQGDFNLLTMHTWRTCPSHNMNCSIILHLLTLVQIEIIICPSLQVDVIESSMQYPQLVPSNSACNSGLRVT